MTTFVKGAVDLSSIFPIKFVTIVIFRVMRSGDHHTAGCPQLFNAKGLSKGKKEIQLTRRKEKDARGIPTTIGV